MTEPQDFLNGNSSSWCKGCLFNSTLSSLVRTLADCNVSPSGVNIISGIGCSSRLPFFMNSYGMHTLHGRAIPVACGARLARPDIPVIVTAGDGDLFSIGLTHFVHAANKNINITVLCMDNRMFAMTKNQSSPTSECGHMGSMTPGGKYENALNVIELAIVSGATFVAQTRAADENHMTDMFTAAFLHRGFSFVHIFSPCLTFGKLSYERDCSKQIIDINKAADRDLSDRRSALEYASTSFNNESEEITVGIFLKRSLPVFEYR